LSIVCCIITYNDFPLIKDCIESVIGKVDRIICIDGKYIDFPGSEDFSTDGTLEYLKSISKVELMFWKGDEISKRNFYLMQVNDGDTVLNLDADEVLIGDLPELKSDWGIINLHDGHDKHIQSRASRLFKFKEGIHYQNTHCTLYDKNNVIINKLQKVINPEFSFEIVKSCYIEHRWHLRPDERKYYKQQYYRKLVKSEAGQIK
jgi:hypothetical protein